MKNVIVTGASGFIGTTLVNELLNRKYNIVAIDRRFTDDFLNNPNITRYIPDNTNINAVLLRGIKISSNPKIRYITDISNLLSIPFK